MIIVISLPISVLVPIKANGLKTTKSRHSKGLTNWQKSGCLGFFDSSDEIRRIRPQSGEKCKGL